MPDEHQTEESVPTIREDPDQSTGGRERRSMLRRLGRFAAVTGPAVTLLLAVTTKPNKAVATSTVLL
jgi:hypothetical protein